MKLFHCLTAATLTPACGVALGVPSGTAFYQEAARIAPEGKLGQVVKQEPIATPVPGAVAWKIAYISSDVNNQRTIATGLVVAADGDGTNRPVLAWAHGTTGTAQNNGPGSRIVSPANLSRTHARRFACSGSVRSIQHVHTPLSSRLRQRGISGRWMPGSVAAGVS